MDGDSDLSEDLSQIVGLEAWALTRTHGSMFILDIGERKMRPRDLRPHGEWTLLVENAFWRMALGKEYLVSSFDDKTKIDSEFSKIVLSRVSSVTFAPHNFLLHLAFVNELSITISNNPRTEDDQWILYTPLEKTWVATSSGIHHEALSPR
jgi:hypothetical protein